MKPLFKSLDVLRFNFLQSKDVDSNSTNFFELLRQFFVRLATFHDISLIVMLAFLN